MVSVLIPNFNSEAFIAETLESIIPQIKNAGEIVLVDDHSTDHSVNLARSILVNSRVEFKILKNTTKGACSARNLALRESKHPHILWLDSDDKIDSNRISVGTKFLAKNPRQIHACPWLPFTSKPRKGQNLSTPSWNDIPKSSSPAEWLARDKFMGLHCYMGHRSVFEQAGPWDESLLINQDGEYFARVIASCEKVFFDGSVEVFYRRDGGGVSKFSTGKADSLFHSIESIAKTGLKLEDSHRMRQMISNRWQRFIYEAYPNVPELITKAQAQLERLPPPTLNNPNTVSLLSRTFSALFGWKTLIRARVFRDQLRGT